MSEAAKVGGEFRVNTETLGNQVYSTITALTDGGFFVVWADSSQTVGDASASSVKGQFFNASGGKIGSELLINTQTDGFQSYPEVTTLSNGNLVVTWRDTSETLGDSLGNSVKAQVIAADGAKVGGEFLVNTQTSSNQANPTVTDLANGNFVITWDDGSATLGDADSSSVKAQIFSASGSKVGTEFLVNTQTAGGQYTPDIAGLKNGGFVVTWYEATSGREADAKAQVYSAAGEKVGAEFNVATQSANSQSRPRVAALANGDFAITWYDFGGTLGDSSDSSIKAQIFSAAGEKEGGEFLVNTETANGQFDPAITGLSSGGFVISWTDTSGEGGRQPTCQHQGAGFQRGRDQARGRASRQFGSCQQPALADPFRNAGRRLHCDMDRLQRRARRHERRRDKGPDIHSCCGCARR
ncbi:MAG: hypothetical protein ACKVOL_14545 [Novosphingobium sp.]